jgi:hypothetical protein
VRAAILSAVAIVLMAVVAVELATSAAPAAAAAQAPTGTPFSSGGPSSPGVPPSERPLGRTYTQWSVASWQWLLANGRSTARPHAGAWSCITRGQRGKVWFLQDEYEGDGPVTVGCEVPAGRYLFLEGPAFECSTVEAPPFRATVRGLARCVRQFKLGGTDLMVDGVPLRPAAYTVITPVFRFVMPARNNVLMVPGKTRGYALARAEAVMLRPLAPGTHTIVQVEHFASGKSVQTTWQLKVP